MPAVVAAPSAVPSAAVTAVSAAAPAQVGSTGAPAVGTARHPVPKGALHVSPGGSDGAPGTPAAPLLTIRAAIAAARPGQTVVLRAGSYHESVQIPDGSRLTLQNYPGEPVWLDGSVRVWNFVPEAGIWRLDGWTATFDASQTYTAGRPPSDDPDFQTVGAEFPMAAHPDQVWIDGTPQHQVASREEVVNGAFFVDEDRQRLYLGSDPTGREVRASDLSTAVRIRSADATVRGIGVRRYATSLPQLAAVTAERPGITVENMVFTDNATTALSIVAADVTVRRVTTTRSGMLGVHANEADGLLLDRVLSTGNNTEHFNQAPVSGGIKVTRSRDVTVTTSTVAGNAGPGVWFDESVHTAVLVNSTVVDNAGHGVSVEISAAAVVANSYIAGNDRTGLKINNVTGARIWNTTVVGNGRPVWIVQDRRRAADLDEPGHDPRRELPDPTVPWITADVEMHNSILGTATGDCLACVEDHSGEFTGTQLGVSLLGNVYQRSAAGPPALALWPTGPGVLALASLRDLRRATGQETLALELRSTPAVNGEGAAHPVVVAAAARLALPLPDDVAALIGQQPGVRQFGVFW